MTSSPRGRCCSLRLVDAFWGCSLLSSLVSRKDYAVFLHARCRPQLRALCCSWRGSGRRKALELCSFYLSIRVCWAEHGAHLFYGTLEEEMLPSHAAGMFSSRSTACDIHITRFSTLCPSHGLHPRPRYEAHLPSTLVCQILYLESSAFPLFLLENIITPSG